VPPPDSQNPNDLPSQQQISQDQEKFDGEILVSSRIIDELSSGLYESPAACLKELVNNAYDADATEVVMSVRPDADVIIINDNGTGLSRENFIGHFRRIAESLDFRGFRAARADGVSGAEAGRCISGQWDTPRDVG